MANALQRLKALNPETEVWWDSSPLIYPNFQEDFPKTVPAADQAYIKEQLDSIFLGAPVDQWVMDGCTTNPPLSWAVLKTRKAEWAEIIKEKRKAYKGRSIYGLFKEVYYETVKRGAEAFMPLFEASGGKLGHISGQVYPLFNRNQPAMIEMGEELADLAPNVMVKVPGSTEGMGVFKHLASKGIATNGTAIFTTSQIMTVGQMIKEGRAIHLKENATPRHGWRAVCTMMAGRLEDSGSLRGVINKKNLDISPLELRWASLSVMKKTANLFVERDMPIKILKCSDRLHHDETGAPFYPHVEGTAGGPIVHTMPPKVIGETILFYKDREFENKWDDEAPQDVMDKLMQVPYFTKALDEDGYAVEQFNEIPSYLENETEFVGAATEMFTYVGSFL